MTHSRMGMEATPVIPLLGVNHADSNGGGKALREPEANFRGCAQEGTAEPKGLA
jgi:hypothetical protein